MASQPIFQFYAELSNFESRIWRRFQVMNNITMAKLGYIIMTMFEMQASHLFCFDVPRRDNYMKSSANEMILFPSSHKFPNLRIELPFIDPICYDDESNKNAAEISLKQVVKIPSEEILFTYDYGDDWEIKLILEEVITNKELPGKLLPRVLDGAGYGIIEDCGGASGLTDLVDALNGSKGERYDMLRQWFSGNTLDIYAFDLDDMNFRLKKVPRIYCDIYEHNLTPSQHSIDILDRNYANT